MMRQAQIYVITAPSGTGKTSLVGAVLAADPAITVSVSYTTRMPRPSEVNGQSYHFVSTAQFKEKIEHGDFAEYAEVYGHWYGTDWQRLASMRAEGRDVLLEIDCQGAMYIKKRIPEACLIFIAPPSLTVLRERLEGRNEDDESVIKQRLSQAQAELRQWQSFDYVVFNDVFDQAKHDLLCIIQAHRHRVEALRVDQRMALDNMLETR